MEAEMRLALDMLEQITGDSASKMSISAES